MLDLNAPAPVAGRPQPRAPLELNLVALVLIGLITLAELAAATFGGLQLGFATAIAGNAVTGLFAIINRSPAP
jgi:hypothetical protein